ncbi:diacylglycerol kinase [Alysiella filiformis]|uniref:Diacylglycerol kinase n=1 Tax=Alysiella filiformis DSM 16848 TaxID=1120981 RepID=A0A286E1T8_9NEIS|nr:diacylglycerol kinase [Alysiella filiformis]QMT30800.1 diacylglycerol kinase [Alysiella filiformis]UBQ56219.1 diacylglycerol kinase [Alysiella filiformis DSM 16848]SOD64867.1 diacylglycerol kinase (ATP) [Alysiella filiformis DSM 16848]
MENQPPNNELKGKTGFTRIINAAHYSKDGLQAAYTHEAAFRQLVYLNGALIILIFWCDFDTATRMMLLLASALSLIVELFNTGIEAVVDDISLAKRPLAKRAKDVGSAAQMLAMTAQGILWLLALFG